LANIAADEVLLSSEQLTDGTWRTRLSVPSLHCAGCMRTVEDALIKLDEVSKSRVNLTRKFVDVEWRGSSPPSLIETIEASGHEAHLSSTEAASENSNNTHLLKATAVAGFASSNIMLMSVAVWSGATPDMANLFHWLSALIAFPTLIYSGRVFFRSAWSALKHKTTNMDVPISVGVSLAFALSLYDTIAGHSAVYFDASVMLLFFLLIGRTLDQWVRSKVLDTAAAMEKLFPKGTQVVDGDQLTYRKLSEVAVGETIEVLHGTRIPLDGRVETGRSSVDTSVVNGESLPVPVQTGSQVLAGMLNLEKTLLVKVTANEQKSFIAQTVRLMDQASSSRTTHRPLADRMANYYSPVVHLAALLTLLGWMVAGADVHQAISIAIAVLIITCPCALALAVPMVQIIAVRRLFNEGTIARHASALERLTDVDTVVFDKTGTVTFGKPVLTNTADIPERAFAIARAMAAHSSHPYSRAIFEHSNLQENEPYFTIGISDVSEHPGQGVAAIFEGQSYRLGLPTWAVSGTDAHPNGVNDQHVILSKNGEAITHFRFEDVPLPDASTQVEGLMERNIEVRLLSGDRKSKVAKIATHLGIKQFQAECKPDDKSTIIKELTAESRKVLMIGDGINDVPALSQAHVSMAPSNAADIGRSAADFVFLNARKLPVLETLHIAKMTNRLVRQNFALAIAYNIVALPIAIGGFATPLIAAVAMSTSSILVALNSARLLWSRDVTVSKDDI